MKNILIFLALVLMPLTSFAQQAPIDNFGVKPLDDDEIFYSFRADRFEYRWKEDDRILLWDVKAWVGGDINKLYVETEGEKVLDGDLEDASFEFLYSRAISPFWDIQAGARHDFQPQSNRGFAVLGVLGTAPYWFDVDAAAYVSEDGDISASIEVEYDLLLSQRLILQPRFEIDLAVQDVPEYNIGAGITDIELGLRLRYEIRREFAPYIGLSWTGKIGKTADMVEADGEDVDAASLVAGVKFWF